MSREGVDAMPAELSEQNIQSAACDSDPTGDCAIDCGCGGECGEGACAASCGGDDE